MIILICGSCSSKDVITKLSVAGAICQNCGRELHLWEMRPLCVSTCNHMQSELLSAIEVNDANLTKIGI
jgi:hypothetical protein